MIHALRIVLAMVVCLMGFMACGGQNSSDVSGRQGSAVAATGKVKTQSFTARDVVSVLIPASSSVPDPMLAIIFSDAPGLCQQANTGAFEPNSTIFMVLAVDYSGTSSTLSLGSYAVVAPSQIATVGAGVLGVAEVLGETNVGTVLADAGQLTITLLNPNVDGTAAGSLSATVNNEEILGGRFEAPICPPLLDIMLQILGL